MAEMRVPLDVVSAIGTTLAGAAPAGIVVS